MDFYAFLRQHADDGHTGHDDGDPSMAHDKPDEMQHDMPGDGDPTPAGTSGTTNQTGAPGVSGHSSHPPMSPFLITTKTGFFVLFREAFINSTGAFVGALLLSFVFAILATFLSQVIRVHENLALANGKVTMRFLTSLLHGFRQLLHYTAMLLVMTMNVWIIIAVVLGHALGWFVYSLVLHNRFRDRLADASDKSKGIDANCDC